MFKQAKKPCKPRLLLLKLDAPYRNLYEFFILKIIKNVEI